MAEIVVLPVVRIERGPPMLDGVEWVADPRQPAPVTDINAFRYARERQVAERRERQTLLPCEGG